MTSTNVSILLPSETVQPVYGAGTSLRPGSLFSTVREQFKVAQT